MLDFDLAGIYEVETRVLNQSVKRNIRRFPDDFMFQLTRQEFTNLMSQFVTSSWGGTRKLPFAFTELGATMLSTVLKSDVSIDASILVIRAFVAVRQLVLNPPTDRITELEKRMKELEDYIEGVFTDYNDIHEDTRMQLELVNQALADLQTRKSTNPPRRRIGYRTNDEDAFI